MRAVKLLQPELVETTLHDAGAVVMLTDHRADALIRVGQAEAVEGGEVKVANPDHNKLNDVIDPAPPGGLILDPALAASHVIEHNPGLIKAVEIAPGLVAGMGRNRITQQDVAENIPAEAAKGKAAKGARASEAEVQH